MHKRLAALHSLLLKYTPPLISCDWQNQATNIIKPTQTGVNREKYTFWVVKALEHQKNFKTGRVP
jgi:hypothetical protein